MIYWILLSKRNSHFNWIKNISTCLMLSQILLRLLSFFPKRKRSNLTLLPSMNNRNFLSRFMAIQNDMNRFYLISFQMLWNFQMKILMLILFWMQSKYLSPKTFLKIIKLSKIMNKTRNYWKFSKNLRRIKQIRALKTI